VNGAVNLSAIERWVASLPEAAERPKASGEITSTATTMTTEFNDLKAEQCVLGAILLDNEAINHALEILAPEDSYRDSHREIYRAMIELIDLPSPIDAITLTDWLKKNGKLESIDGTTYIAELASIVPTASNIVHYSRLVREKGRQGS
jgi:replicative DNA helicase